MFKMGLKVTGTTGEAKLKVGHDELGLLDWRAFGAAWTLDQQAGGHSFEPTDSTYPCGYLSQVDALGFLWGAVILKESIDL